MGNLITLPNITPDSIVIEGDSGAKKTSSFDTKNYLDTRLSKGETEKTIAFRLLPMDLETGNPFVKIHVHNVSVPKSMVGPDAKPFKSYLCLSRNKDIDHEKFGKKCPYCEINKDAYQKYAQATDPQEKKYWSEISLNNLAREAVICRGIQRGKEEEGPKFWKFNLRADKTDPYNQIIKLYNLRKKNAEAKGSTENILDIYNGRDLNITFSEGTAAPKIIDDSDRSPLSESEEKMREWIYDSKKWQEVFTAKPYEYLSLVSQMKHPWFDRSNNIWVDKDEFDGVQNEASAAANSEIEAASAKLVEMANAAPSAPAQNDILSSVTVNDDDLPF